MNTQPTDQQLQLALAKMLPDKIKIGGSFRTTINGTQELHTWKSGSPIFEAEWLHVCWLMEQTLDSPQSIHYSKVLQQDTMTNESNYWPFYFCNASWQQRATALCKVKGISI